MLALGEFKFVAPKYLPQSTLAYNIWSASIKNLNICTKYENKFVKM